MKLNELQKQLQTNFKVQVTGERWQQTIKQIKIGRSHQGNLRPGQLYLAQRGPDVACQATGARLIIKDCADLVAICNQLNTALLTESRFQNELLALNLQKYDLDQLLKIIDQRFKLALIVYNLNDKIIGSTENFFKNKKESSQNHKNSYPIRDQNVQLGKFSWQQGPGSWLLTADLLQTLSQVLSKNLLANQLVSVLNSPTEVMLVRLLKSQQVADLEVYFQKRQQTLPNWLAFIYVRAPAARLSGLKQTVQELFREFFGFAISSVYQGQLISLVKMPLPVFFHAETRAFLKQQAQKLQAQFLVTNPVRQLTELRTAHQAAMLITKYHVLTAAVNFCAAAALPLLVGDHFNLRLTNYVLNPVPQFLANYDQAQGTQLLPLLKTYLASDCSIEKTAARLYLHRNSVTNHLRKLARLTGINYHKLKQLQSLQLAVAIYQLLQKQT